MGYELWLVDGVVDAEHDDSCFIDKIGSWASLDITLSETYFHDSGAGSAFCCVDKELVVEHVLAEHLQQTFWGSHDQACRGQ